MEHEYLDYLFKHSTRTVQNIYVWGGFFYYNYNYHYYIFFRLKKNAYLYYVCKIYKKTNTGNTRLRNKNSTKTVG